MRALLALLRCYCAPEWLAHPWRYLSAVLAVALGLAVQLINQSAVGEYERAAKVLDGAADVQVRAVAEQMPTAVLDQLLMDESVAVASPVIDTIAYAAPTSKPTNEDRIRILLMGLDVLSFGQISPSVLAFVPSDATQNAANQAMPSAWFSAQHIFVNEAAWAKLRAQAPDLKSGQPITLFIADRAVPLQIAGVIALPGGPAMALDVGALQALSGRENGISRVDIRLKPGVNAQTWQREFKLPAGAAFAQSGDRAERAQSSSRAYRANLTALALVALFVGAYLVFSVVSLSVAKRLPQWALLGVLGLDAKQRLRLVLAESAVLGAAGAALGLAIGIGLAGLALTKLGGDLGGGYFSGRGMGLAWSLSTFAWLAAYAALGIGAACVGALVPAWELARMPLAQALKATGWVKSGAAQPAWVWPLCMAAGAAVCLAPPVLGISAGAYVGIALLLVGGIATLPPLLARAAGWALPQVGARPVLALALSRAWRMPQTSAAAISGVVAALALAVALIVMVASFRTSLIRWLDVMLPAPLYLRSAGGGIGAGFLSADTVAAVTSSPQVLRSVAARNINLALKPDLPVVWLQAVDGEEIKLDWVAGSPLAVTALKPGETPLYLSEAMLSLHGARLGEVFALDLKGFGSSVQVSITSTATNLDSSPAFRVMGVWRDYGRQHGSIVMRLADYRAITADQRVNDLYIWPRQGVAIADLQQHLADRAAALPAKPQLDFTSADRIRAISMQAFDRSFAVTNWLQAVAIGIGLFGVAASFSAQVLARRKEFGLLAHVGFTRRQLHGLVALEGAVWTALGAVTGLLLGLCIAVVLVHVVNPQSFNWTMDLDVPWLRVLPLLLAVLAAGTLTTWLAGRAAAGAQAVMAVKEDW